MTWRQADWLQPTLNEGRVVLTSTAIVSVTPGTYDIGVCGNYPTLTGWDQEFAQVQVLRRPSDPVLGGVGMSARRSRRRLVRPFPRSRLLGPRRGVVVCANGPVSFASSRDRGVGLAWW